MTPPFLSEVHARSRRRAVFEDTGAAAFLYLSVEGSNAIAADAWVYNRVQAPAFDGIERYRPDPPPAAEGYAGPEARIPEPDARAWSLTWAPDGHSVAICGDGVPLAFIRGGRKPGFSRHIVKSGPWGEPWSDEIFAETFG